jgi:hypothetical protein
LSTITEETEIDRRVTIPGVGRWCLPHESSVVTGYPESRVSAHVFREYALKDVLPLFHQARGALCLHASGVVSSGASCSLAFAGTSHAGKSTFAQAWLRRFAGDAQLADDALVLYLVEGRFVPTLLEHAPSLRPPTRAYFGSDAPLLRPVSPGAVVPELGAVYLLDPGGTEDVPRVAAVDLRAAFTELLPHTFCFALGDEPSRRLLYASVLDLIAVVPIRRLIFRHDFARLEHALEAVARDAAGLAARA